MVNNNNMATPNNKRKQIYIKDKKKTIFLYKKGTTQFTDMVKKEVKKKSIWDKVWESYDPSPYNKIKIKIK